MRLLSPSLLLVASLRLTQVLAWGAAGHEIIATIAQIHLHPSVLPKICPVLNLDRDKPLCHLAPIASWADKVRLGKRWSAPLHYIGAVDDHPPEVCAFPGKQGWVGSGTANVLAAIRNTTGLLEHWTEGSVSDEAANEALKFLVHFVGDMHQPLHLTNRDRGGNGVKVRFGARVTKLHAVWDNNLVAKAIRETPRKYSSPTRSHEIESALRGAVYDSYIRRIMLEGVLDKWSKDLEAWVSCPAQASDPFSVWRMIMTNLKSFVRRIPGPGQGTDDDVLCPYAWAKPVHQLNCDIVWPKELDEPQFKHASRLNAPAEGHDHRCGGDSEFFEENDLTEYLDLDTPKYAGRVKDEMIVEHLFAQAGLRLAAVLNWLFADEHKKIVKWIET